MKRKTSLAMGGKAIPFALSLLTANLLVANTALAQDDNKNLEKSLLQVHTLRALALMKRHPSTCLIATIFRSRVFTIGELTQKLAVSSGTKTIRLFTSGSTQGTSTLTFGPRAYLYTRAGQRQASNNCSSNRHDTRSSSIQRQSPWQPLSG